METGTHISLISNLYNYSYTKSEKAAYLKECEGEKKRMWVFRSGENEGIGSDLLPTDVQMQL